GAALPDQFVFEAQPVQRDLGVGPGVIQAGLHGYSAGRVVRRVLLDAQVRGDLADDIAHHRRHHLAGVIAQPAGVVQHHEHLDLRVVHRQHGGKAHGLVVVAVVAFFAVGTLGGAGLAADAVARHIGVLVGMVVVLGGDVGVHAGLHHGQQLLADFLRDDLAADGGLGLLHHVAVGVGD